MHLYVSVSVVVLPDLLRVAVVVLAGQLLLHLGHLHQAALAHQP